MSVTIVRGAQPIELDRFGSSVILACTRSGRHELFLSLRDTYSTSDRGGHVIESTSGGRIVPERLTAEAIVSRAEGDSEDVHLRDDAVVAKVSYRIADHVISAGGRHGSQETTRGGDAFFVSDRWASGRWTIDAGLRRDDERTTTRIAVAFDLRSSQGSHALVASWGEYLEEPRPGFPAPARSPVQRIASIGYTSSLESQGTARIDLFHYEGARAMDQVQADARYRIFDRFEAGGSYVYTRTDEPDPFGHEVPEHLVSARTGVQLPVAGHEFAAMVLERYDSQTWTTDFGVRYEIPIRRVALTLAGDATNVFDAAEFRVWARIRR